MRRFLFLAGLAAAAPAAAQTIDVKPLAEARLRYEGVSQEGLPRDADAVTLRVRTGVQATAGPWSALAEAQGNLAIVDDYYDGLHGGAATRPLVNDPQNVALYRAQLQYRTKALAVTAGRQRIALDDERFVGPGAFRQNGQTFDGVRAEWTGVPKLKADVSYLWSVRTIWGVDGTGARQQAIGGDNVLVNLAAQTRFGTVTGFAYLVDQDEAAVLGFQLSSQTYGVRFAGAQPLSPVARLSYAASYARQSDYRRNPNDFTADYYLIEGAIEHKALKVTGGYEVLGASSGVALTSVQTPLATLFRMQGWANKFLTTPPDGVRDLYGSAGLSWKTIGTLRSVSVQAAYHRFGSDRLIRHYGDEIDLLASAKLGRTTASIRYADYDADRFATGTRKFWLQLDWAI